MTGYYKDYLPSKHFQKILLACVGIALVVFLGTKLVGRVEKKRIERAAVAQQEALKNGTLVAISDLVATDSDQDGVADWEEALWGTDPKNQDTDNNGKTDKEEIEAKKMAMGGKGSTSSEDGSVSETEAFSQELFTSIAALKESGNLNEKSIQELATTISENAGDKETITDSYTSASIKTQANSPTAAEQYHETMLSILQKYDPSDIGKELEIIDASLSAQDKDKISDLYDIATAYKNLAKDFAGVTIPEGASDIHLRLVNGANNVSISLENVTQIYDNALRGLIGISQYQNESTAFETAFADLQNYFKVNGILR